MASKRPSERDELVAEIKATLADVWKQGGRAAVEAMCEESPEKFVQTCAALIPKEMAVMIGSPYDDCRDPREVVSRMLQAAGAEQVTAQMIESATEVLERCNEAFRRIVGVIENEAPESATNRRARIAREQRQRRVTPCMMD